MDKNTAILNYFIGDSTLYIACIADSLYKIEEIPIDSSFKILVTRYSKDIRTAETGLFTKNSHALYEKLINPVKAYIAGKNHLVIIPDDYLYYVPFETLIENAPSTINSNEDFTKPDYLIKSHFISYQHSATLWYNSKKRKKRWLQTKK